MEDELKDANEVPQPTTMTQDDADESWDWVLPAGVSREDLRKVLQLPPGV